MAIDTFLAMMLQLTAMQNCAVCVASLKFFYHITKQNSTLNTFLFYINNKVLSRLLFSRPRLLFII
jgi:hypothetical protein